MRGYNQRLSDHVRSEGSSRLKRPRVFIFARFKLLRLLQGGDDSSPGKMAVFRVTALTVKGGL